MVTEDLYSYIIETKTGLTRPKKEEERNAILFKTLLHLRVCFPEPLHVYSEKEVLGVWRTIKNVSKILQENHFKL